MYVCVCMYVCMYDVCICMCVYVCVCVCVCIVCVCVGVCMYVCVYVYRQARSQPSRWGWGVWTWMGGTLYRRGYRISWRRGGGEDIPKHHHPPWTLSAWRHPPSEKLKNTPHSWTFKSTPTPLDIVRVTSSALRKIEKHPHSWAFTSTPPWTVPVWHHPHSRGGGGGDRSRSRTLCIGFQYRDKFKGGGVIIPVTPPRIRHCYIQGVWLGCLYHGRNKESSSKRRNGWGNKS